MIDGGILATGHRQSAPAPPALHCHALCHHRADVAPSPPTTSPPRADDDGVHSRSVPRSCLRSGEGRSPDDDGPAPPGRLRSEDKPPGDDDGAPPGPSGGGARPSSEDEGDNADDGAAPPDDAEDDGPAAAGRRFDGTTDGADDTAARGRAPFPRTISLEGDAVARGALSGEGGCRIRVGARTVKEQGAASPCSRGRRCTNSQVKDQRVLDMLVEKGYMELEEFCCTKRSRGRTCCGSLRGSSTILLVRTGSSWGWTTRWRSSLTENEKGYVGVEPWRLPSDDKRGKVTSDG